MNEEQKDKGLKRAVKAENELATYFGDVIREAFTPTENLKPDNIQIPAFWVLILITIPLFVLFDRWMRKRYYKHHS